MVMEDRRAQESAQSSSEMISNLDGNVDEIREILAALDRRIAELRSAGEFAAAIRDRELVARSTAKRSSARSGRERLLVRAD